MIRKQTALLILGLVYLSGSLYGQVWSGILDPSRAIDWSSAGIPGGIPSRTVVCTNWYNGPGAPSPGLGNSGDYYFRNDVGHASAEYKKLAGIWTTTGNEFTTDVNSALSACPSNDVVYLNSGTYFVSGNISVPSNVVLRGAGANLTILNANGSSGTVVIVGSATAPSISNSVSITGGATGGSTSITVSNSNGITVGKYLLITELNNQASYSVATGSEGSCTWCDGSIGWNGTRVRGQIVEVESVSNNTITISPGLYGSYSNALPGWTPNTSYPLNSFINPAQSSSHSYQQTVNNYNSPYTCTTGSTAPNFPTNGSSVNDGTCTWKDIGATTTSLPLATPFTAAKYAGVENLQVYANNTGYGANFAMVDCAYCWISGVEGNYTDGDHAQVDWSYRGDILDSYFSNAYLHTPGSSDSDLVLRNKSSAMLVQNNIFERLHVSIMLEWGAAGNVIGYNYSLGAFDTNAANAVLGGIDLHGAHPQFNLFEGNVLTAVGSDSTWGSHANNTSFREYLVGTTKACNPTSGRGAVTCSGNNGWWEFQASRDISITYEGMNWNSVGNVVGSAAQSGLKSYGNPIGLVNQVVAVCGPSPCGPGSRSYDNVAYAYSVGYGETFDDGSSGLDSLAPFASMLVHGDYSNITGSIQWANGITHTLPPSFYLTAQPSWWSSVPYPAIGPDVVGGPGPGGHAYAIPAQNCYASMGGTDGTGSPSTFNSSTCYGQGLLDPPTNMNAIAK